jgi:hypothetical protein
MSDGNNEPQTTEAPANTGPLGTAQTGSEWRPLRSVIGEIRRTPNGNSALRVGREVAEGSSVWEQTEYVVLTPSERTELIRQLLAEGDDPGRRAAKDLPESSVIAGPRCVWIHFAGPEDWMPPWMCSNGGRYTHAQVDVAIAEGAHVLRYGTES